MQNQSFKAASDSFGSATFASDLAKKLIELALADKSGTYHLCNRGIFSYYEMAHIIEDHLKTGSNFSKVSFSELGLCAERPKYTPMMSRHPEAKMRPVKDALIDFLNQIQTNEKSLN